MPGTDGWKKRIVTFHLRLGRMLIEKESYDEAVNHQDNIKEYFQQYGYHDEVSRLEGACIERYC